MSQQLDMFVPVPDWLLYLRMCEEFEEIPYEKGVPINYWHCAGLYRWYGINKYDVGVNVGHWYESCWCDGCQGQRHWYVLVLFEDGKVEKFSPFSLFPSEKPDWWSIPTCWQTKS